MNTIVFIHFSPLEFYPPVQNLLRELEANNTSKKVIVFTTGTFVNLSTFSIDSKEFKIIRIGASGKRLSLVIRAKSYLFFYLGCLLRIILYKPSSILYFETLSSFPAYFYKRFINPACKILVHYHEYTSPSEYKSGMKITRYFHKLEKWLYPVAQWISHTNEYRMDKFKEDILPVRFKTGFILPNHPPKHWFTVPRPIIKFPIKIVYAGALSLSTMYTREFAEWVEEQQGDVVWDIYTYNYDTESKRFLESLNSNYIRVIKGVAYDGLSSILKDYDIGVILYNGHIPNYIYNAPNKLFEYAISGLSVWLPNVMLGSLPYCTNLTFPEIRCFNFDELKSLKPSDALTPSQYSPTIADFCCHDTLKPLIIALDL